MNLDSFVLVIGLWELKCHRHVALEAARNARIKGVNMEYLRFHGVSLSLSKALHQITCKLVLADTFFASGCVLAVFTLLLCRSVVGWTLSVVCNSRKSVSARNPLLKRKKKKTLLSEKERKEREKREKSINHFNTLIRCCSEESVPAANCSSVPRFN